MVSYRRIYTTTTIYYTIYYIYTKYITTQTNNKKDFT